MSPPRAILWILLAVALWLTPAVPTLAQGTIPPPSLPSAPIWSVDISAPPAAPPVIDGARVYVALQSGDLAAYRIADGSQIWRKPLRTAFPIEIAGDHIFVVSGEAIHAITVGDGSTAWVAPAGTVTAPLLVQDGWIVAAAGSEVAAFRTADGTRIWRTPSGPQTRRASIEGTHLYLPLHDRVVALDLATGRTRWQHHVPDPSEVLAFDDLVYFGSSDHFFYCFKAPDGRFAWRFRTGAAARGKPVADDTLVYAVAVDNMLRGFDRRSGARRWHVQVRFRATTGPVLVGTAIVIPGATAGVHAWRPDGTSAGQIALDEPLVMPPTFSRTGAMMAALTGGLSERWRLTLTERPLVTMPLVPLTTLPGEVVPIQVPRGLPQAHLEPRHPAGGPLP